MPSLDEAYERPEIGGRDPRRVLAGLALVALGGLAIVASIVLVGIGGADAVGAKRIAAVLAGIGVPVALCGVVVVLPANRRERVGVLVGALVTLLGVGLFWMAYPAQWIGAEEALAFETVTVYAAGCVVALWFVFTALATARRRNAPHGTVTLEVVRQGSTRTFEVSKDRYRRIVSDGGDPQDVIRELED